MSQKPIPHSINSRLDDIKAEKCGPKLTILASSSYAYRRRRRTNSNPSGKVPSSLTKFSPEERTDYVMRPITDSSRTHGTRPDSGDSTPNAELSVRLLTPSIFYTLTFFYFSPSPSLSLTAFKGSFAPCSHTIDALSALIIPGGFFNRSLFIRASCPTHVLHFRMYLLFTIVCIDMT